MVRVRENKKNGFDVNTITELSLSAIFIKCSCLATWSDIKEISPRVNANKN